MKATVKSDNGKKTLSLVPGTYEENATLVDLEKQLKENGIKPRVWIKKEIILELEITL